MQLEKLKEKMEKCNAGTEKQKDKTDTSCKDLKNV